MAQEWTAMSLLYCVSVKGYYYYIQLHEHFGGDFEQALLEITHHDRVLKQIRAVYSTCHQIICKIYADLHNQVSKSF